MTELWLYVETESEYAREHTHILESQMEKVMKLTASLPPNSKMRKKLSDTIVTTMWNTLQHPPQSYYGDNYQYRTADGSNNVGFYPNLQRPS